MNSKYPSMPTLYKKLKIIGFPRPYIKEMLPEWWDRECETHPESIMEGIIYLSRRLNLELDSLLDNDSIPKFKATYQPKFKIQQGKEPEKLKISYSLASRVAELASYGCKNIYQPVHNMSEAEIRKNILKNKQYIDLERVLNFCWNIGIPVIHFTKLPKGAKKFDGMITCFDNRPIIIISLNDRSASKLLFIILHELGHIYKKHIDSSSLIDEKIKLDSNKLEEIEANQFANQILFNNPQANYHKNINIIYISGNQLAEIARNYSRQVKNISPQSIIMNYSWYKAEENKSSQNIIWRTANKALKIIGENYNAPSIINQQFKANLDWNKLSEDNQEYLEIMTNLYLY